MNNFTAFLALLLSLSSVAGVMAQALPPPPPHLAAPDPVVITGTCPGLPATVYVIGQDPTTLYWSGIAYAEVPCPTKDNSGVTWWRGCADVMWDPTGTTITYKIRFQEQITGSPTKAEKVVDLNKRCFGGHLLR